MKKLFVIILSISATLLISACAREEFIDLSGFSKAFDYQSLSPESFYVEESGENLAYFTFFHREKSAVMLKLISEKNNKISEIRIYLPKYDENASKRKVASNDIYLFTEVSLSALKAFTGYSEEISEIILSELQLYKIEAYKNKGELTKAKENYYFVYHSSNLGCELVITDTYLKDIPETEKPESRPMFGDIPDLRTETVPLK